MKKAKKYMKNYASLTIATGVGAAAAGRASAGTPAAGMMPGFGTMAAGARIGGLTLGAGMALDSLKGLKKRKRRQK
ncbi:unnamed protein product [marine sediment metagenome]|uniref:Uncharacterized protein n=1 Tax=marine sediment metagenome TaxID=412755 RepID=X1EI80_9ZZZZ